MAKTLSVTFLGDRDGDIVFEIYEMLFYGNNIRAMKHDEYHPVFDDEERQMCINVFNDGFTLLNSQIDAFQVELLES